MEVNIKHVWNAENENTRKWKRKKTFTCCDEEDIRNTFKQLNCKIVYLNELNYMLNLDRATARIIDKMIACSNLAIVETIKESSFIYIVNIFVHLGFNIDRIINCDVNVVKEKIRKVVSL